MATRVVPAETAADWADGERLIRSYLQSLPFEVDFQDVESEMAGLPTMYGRPDGVLLLVRSDGDEAVGVVGVRRFADGDAELKRMYLRPEARGAGLGRALAEVAVTAARSLGYRRLLLDTVASLTAAIAIYESLGFVDIPAYRHNPFDDARYFALDLVAP
jgi:putative acetyltransferase